MEKGTRNKNKPWYYFALTYGWSWIFLVPAAVVGLSADQTITTWLRFLAGVGPLLSALFLLYTTGNHQSRRDYWKRLVSFRCIKWYWWIVILFTPVTLIFLSGVLDLFLGGKGLQLESGLPEMSNPMGWLGFVLFILIFGPVPEEMGWRGYALDGLQDRWNALISSLILGLAWSLWHLPLFFIPGTYQAGLGIFTSDFWIFLLMMIPESILITWIFNNNQRSTLSAVLFHFAINLTGETFFISSTGNWFYFGFWTLAAGLIVWLTNRETFKGKGLA